VVKSSVQSFNAFRAYLLTPVLICLIFHAFYSHAATSGSISGVVADASGAVIPGAELSLVNTAQQTTYQAVSNREGLYSFPNLPVGHYDLTISAPGFATQRKMNLTVDTDSALRVDATLEISSQSDSVTVTTSSSVQVDTIATHLGEIISSSEMTALPLNGRSYTDLLAIQPGVAPISTLLPSSVIGPHQQLRSRIWKLQRRRDHRGHQVGERSISRHSLRVFS